MESEPLKRREGSTPLTAEMIRQAVEQLKKSQIPIPPIPGGQWFSYDEIDVPKLPGPKEEMDKKFKERDERIKKEWGK